MLYSAIVSQSVGGQNSSQNSSPKAELNKGQEEVKKSPSSVIVAGDTYYHHHLY